MPESLENTYTKLLAQQEEFFRALLEGRVILRSKPHSTDLRVIVLPDPDD